MAILTISIIGHNEQWVWLMFLITLFCWLNFVYLLAFYLLHGQHLKTPDFLATYVNERTTPIWEVSIAGVTAMMHTIETILAFWIRRRRNSEEPDAFWVARAGEGVVLANMPKVSGLMKQIADQHLILMKNQAISKKKPIPQHQRVNSIKSRPGK